MPSDLLSGLVVRAWAVLAVAIYIPWLLTVAGGGGSVTQRGCRALVGWLHHDELFFSLFALACWVVNLTSVCFAQGWRVGS